MLFERELLTEAWSLSFSLVSFESVPDFESFWRSEESLEFVFRLLRGLMRDF